MSAILEAVLSEGALRALPFVEEVVSRGLTTFGSFISIIESGLDVRADEILLMVERVQAERQIAVDIMALPLDQVIDPTRLPFSLTSQLRTFSYDVELSGFNAFTGEPQVNFVTVSTEELLTRQEIEDKALSFRSNEAGSPRLGELSIITPIVVAGRRRA